MRLSGTRVLLTGASTGIGRQLGRALAQRGAVLAVAARRRALLDELAAEIAAVGGREPVRLGVDLASRGRRPNSRPRRGLSSGESRS